MTSSLLTKFPNTDVASVLAAGNIIPTIDAYGNLNLISNSTEISSSLVGFPLEKLVYDANYISTYYDTTITEFTPTPASAPATSSTIDLTDQLQMVESQLAQVTANYNMVQQQNLQLGGLQADQSASMALAIGLRIQLGQGKTASDFSATYPWLPISASLTP